MRKLSVLFFVMFMLAVSSYAAEQTIFYDEINFQSNVTLNGYGFSDGGCSGTLPQLPVPSLFGSYAIGSNYTSPCSSIITANIAIYDFTEPIYTGAVTITYDVKVNSSSATDYNPIGFRIPMPFNETGVDYITFWSGDGFYSNQDFRADCGSWATASHGCVSTSYGDMSGIKQRFNGSVTITIDLNNDVYTYITEIGNTTYSSTAAYRNDWVSIEGFEIVQMWASGRAFDCHIDNINIVWEADLTNQSENLIEASPCTSDDQCLSGYCEGGYCRLKTGQMSCTSDSECLSGSCINGKCTRVGLWESLDYGKDVIAGDSPDTNNAISLIIMLLISGSIIMAGRSRATTIVGGVVYFGLAIFFTIVGWLSPFILFGNFFILLIGAVILLVLAGKE